MSGAFAFDYPWALLGFAVFIPLILGDFLAARRKKIQKSLPTKLQARLFASQVLFRIFLACIITALAGPRWGIGEAAMPKDHRLVDAVIALDVSRSMEVQDGRGTYQDGGEPSGISRLEQGLSIIREVVEKAPGMRFGAAISRNRGIVAVPLTWDSDAVLTFLDAADSSVTGRGTNLESLLDAAAGAFQSAHPSARVIILVSDGEAHSGSLKAALGRCKRDGIAVSAVAVGSEEGGTLDEGRIKSYRDSTAMRMAAGQTGGIYIDGNREDASGMLAGYLYSLAPGSQARKSQAERKARWFIFIMSAIITLGASKLCLSGMGSRE